MNAYGRPPRAPITTDAHKCQRTSTGNHGLYIVAHGRLRTSINKCLRPILHCQQANVHRDAHEGPRMPTDTHGHARATTGCPLFRTGTHARPRMPTDTHGRSFVAHGRPRCPRAPADTYELRGHPRGSVEGHTSCLFGCPQMPTDAPDARKRQPHESPQESTYARGRQRTTTGCLTTAIIVVRPRVTINAHGRSIVVRRQMPTDAQGHPRMPTGTTENLAAHCVAQMPTGYHGLSTVLIRCPRATTGCPLLSTDATGAHVRP